MDPSQDYPKLKALKEALPENVRRQFNAKYDQLLKEVGENSAGWTLGKNEGNFVYFTKADDVFVIQKSEITITHPLERVIEVSGDKQARLKFDGNLEDIEYVVKGNEHYDILRAQIKGKFMVISPRDFVTYRVHGYIDDNVRIE